MLSHTQRNEGILKRVHTSSRVILLISITSSVVVSGLFVVVKLLKEDELPFDCVVDIVENVNTKKITNAKRESIILLLYQDVDLLC